jgi:hypothetical protein
MVAAFAAAPLAGAGAVAAETFVSLAILDGSLDFAPRLAVKTLFFESIRAYSVAVILGVPGYLLFRRLGWIRRAHWVLLWAVLGIIGRGTWTLLGFGFSDLLFMLMPTFTLSSLLFGVTAGLVFAFMIKAGSRRADEIAATFD